MSEQDTFTLDTKEISDCILVGGTEDDLDKLLGIIQMLRGLFYLLTKYPKLGNLLIAAIAKMDHHIKNGDENV